MPNSDNIPISLDNFNALLNKYEPLLKATVSKVFKQYRNHPSLEYEDLMQEAALGLMRAIELYDPSKSVYFGIYLKVSVENRVGCFARDFLPHRYAKDGDKKHPSGQQKFKRVIVDVVNLPESLYGDSP